MTRKPFDCVEMKRQAAEQIYEHVKSMTIEEELRFWNTAMAEDVTASAMAEHIKQTNKHWVTHADLKKECGL